MNLGKTLPLLAVLLAAGPSAGAEEDAPIRLAVASILSPAEAYSQYKRFAEYLSARLDTPIELVQRFGYAKINQLIEDQAVDLAVLCTGGYCDVVARGAGEPLVVPVVEGSTAYRSLLVTRENSAVTGFASLRNKTFVFTEPLSLTGFVYPWIRLQQLGGARGILSSYFFSRSHDRSLRSVHFGLAHAAAVDSRVWSYFRSAHPEIISDLVVVERSDPFPIAPLVVPRNLPEKTKARLREVLSGMSSDPTGALVLANLGIDRFVEPDPSAYDEVRKLLRQVEEGLHEEP